MPDAHRGTGRRQDLASGFDYVIVGAGSAGCVVARRLVEGTEATVLVLEAGGSDEGVASIANPHGGWRISPLRTTGLIATTEPAPRQSLAPPGEGQGPGRLRQHQCDALGARQPGRLRRLGAGRQRRLGFPIGPPLVQKVGGLGGRRERVPRGGRADARRASPGSRPGVQPLSSTPVYPTGCLSGRHEYPPPRRRRPPESQRPGRPALQPVDGLPPPGDAE